MGQEGTRFLIRACLGRGGFGEVYRAAMVRPGGVQTDVAVKILRQDVDPGSEAVKRLRDEGRMLGALRHPAILNVHDLVMLAGRVALVTEYVDGQDLDRCILEDPPIPLRPLLAALGEISSALDAAWSTPAADGRPLQLVHRDIKPSNVRIGRHGEVKLLDFGIARATNIVREAQTATNAMMGSYLYMAPERFVNDAVEPPSDMYSLGCVLFEGLTRCRFFDGATLKAIYNTMVQPGRFHTHLESRLQELPDHLPAEVVTVLRDLLQHDPMFRPTAAEAAVRLEELAEQLLGASFKRWVRLRTWPPEPKLVGSLDGRELIAETFDNAGQSLSGGEFDGFGSGSPPGVRDGVGLAGAVKHQVLAERAARVGNAPRFSDTDDTASHSGVVPRGRKPLLPPLEEGDAKDSPPESRATASRSTSRGPSASPEGPPVWHGPAIDSFAPSDSVAPAAGHDLDPLMREPPTLPDEPEVPLALQRTEPPAVPRDVPTLPGPTTIPNAGKVATDVDYYQIDPAEMVEPIPEVFDGSEVVIRRLAVPQPRRSGMGLAGAMLAGGLSAAVVLAVGVVGVREGWFGDVQGAAAPWVEDVARAVQGPPATEGAGVEEAEVPATPPAPTRVPILSDPPIQTSPPKPAPAQVAPAPRSRSRSRRTPTGAQLRALGWKAVEADELGRAVTLFDRVLRRSPRDADALYGKGYALMRLDQRQGAQQAMCLAIRLGREDLRREVRSVMENNDLACPLER